MNYRSEKYFGYSRDELIGEGIDKLVPERFRGNHPGYRTSFLSKPQVRPMGAGRDLYGLHKDGSEFPVEIGLAPIDTTQGTLVMATIVDITERKRAEEQVVQMKRLYATLSQVNQTIVRVKDRDELYRSMCHVAVKFGGFSLAWVGLLDEVSGDVRPVAANGLDITQWPFPTINIHKGALKDGLTAIAIRTSKVVTSDDIQTDKRIQNLYDQSQKYAYHSSAAIPFRLNGKTIGVVSLVAPEIGLFKAKEEVDLLKEMGFDISFAHDSMEAEKAKIYMSAIVKSSNDAIIAKDLNGIVTSWNPAAQNIFGYNADEMLGQPVLRLVPPERVSEEQYILNQIKQDQPVRHYETVRVKKDGTLIDVSLTVSPIRNADGNIIGASKIVHDITERRQAEEDVQKLNAGLEQRVVERTAQLADSQQGTGSLLLFRFARSARTLTRH